MQQPEKNLPTQELPGIDTDVHNVIIRPETSPDIEAIDAVTVSAFLDAAHSDHTEQFIIKALRDAGALTLSLVAETDDTLIGHVGVSPVFISDGSSGWFGLGPISVVPEHQGHGVGSRLINEALNNIRGFGASGCVVLGDPSFYSRFGFKNEPDIKFPDTSQKYFHAIAFDGNLPKGIVSFHYAFNTGAD